MTQENHTYRTQSRDTALDVELKLIERWRQMPLWEKARQWSTLTRMTRKLAWSGLCDRFPDASPEELKERWLVLILGAGVARPIIEQGLTGRVIIHVD